MAGEALKTLPSIEKILQLSPGQAPSVALEVRTHHDLILVRREQLKVSRKVRNHFEKAIKGANKKLEKGEGEVTQSALTKLKLGLAGSLNDISQFQSDIALAQLHLEKILDIRWAESLDISGPKLKPEDFPYKSLADYIATDPSRVSPSLKADEFNLKVAMVAVNKARDQLELARKSRKMTRALLVTEVANYDFGIGNEGDLFEALMIYTQVLVGYYDAIHNFNVSVYRIRSLAGKK